ncbi:MAG: YezD family protein [Patescibacteria group bacterium]|nr:YezD family protein [Patescibacteria group bacterium]
MRQANDADTRVFDEIKDFIRQIKYGEVVITVHDSHVVQIEKKEKKRFNTRKLLDKQS